MALAGAAPVVVAEAEAVAAVDVEADAVAVQLSQQKPARRHQKCPRRRTSCSSGTSPSAATCAATTAIRADAPTAELPLSHLHDLLAQYENLLESWSEPHRPHQVRGHITLTGGEPFLRSDFLPLVERIAARKDRYSFAILTNGTLIDRPIARWLRRLKPKFVQVSVEGTRATHDRLRGKGNLARVEAGVKQLVRAHVRTSISFTAHRENFREFPEVARLGRRLGVHTVWADRLIPTGRGSGLTDQALDPAETREFVNIVANARRYNGRWFSPTRVFSHRALQFLGSNGAPYACTAGNQLITLLPNGDVVPCRRIAHPPGQPVHNATNRTLPPSCPAPRTSKSPSHTAGMRRLRTPIAVSWRTALPGLRDHRRRLPGRSRMLVDAEKTYPPA